jgi:hypothetical protein
MRREYYGLCDNYYADFNRKEAKELTDKIHIKITALEIALVAMNHVENITKGEA